MIVRVLWAVVTTVIILGGCQGVNAQEREDTTSQDEMTAMAMELARPGEEHKLLEKLAGEWDAETKMWMTPGADAMILPGRFSAKMVLGGRFLHGEYSIDTGQLTGEGLFVMGFDRRSEKFTYIHFDTWGTYWISATGTYDEDTRSITMYGEDLDPVTGNTQKYNFAFHFNADDQWQFELFSLDEAYTQGAEPFKMVEVNYTRTE